MRGIIQRSIIFGLTILSVCSFSCGWASPSDLVAREEKLVQDISIKKIMEHEQVLSKKIGIRMAGTEADRNAAQYIRETMEGYGYQVTTQPFQLTNNIAQLTLLSQNGKSVPIRRGDKTPLTDEQGITGKIIDCGDGNDLANFPTLALRGQIALVRCLPDEDDDTVMHKYYRAQRMGAAAVLIASADWKIRRVEAKYYDRANIPFAVMNKDTADSLKGEEGLVNFRITPFRGTQNVIGIRKADPGTDTHQIVVICAHYDSVPTSPGANDNASGVSVMLEVGRVIAQLPRDTEIRLIAFGGEEVGLEGSWYYMDKLADDEKKRIVASFNMDMVGTGDEGDYKLTLLSMDEYDARTPGNNVVTRNMLAAAERMGFKEQMGGVVPMPSSDHVPFYKAGIATADIMWLKDKKPEPWYHTPEDNVEKNLSQERMLTVAKLVGAASYAILSPESPALPIKQ